MEPSVDDLLSFKEFPLIQEGNSNSAQLNIDSPKKVSPSRESDSTEEATPAKSSSFLSFEYYQRFFDVDTMTVVDRIATSIIPKRAPSDYLKLNIGTSPDLYGPVWIVITLIFTIAISGNMASYLQNAGNHHWRYNFHLVSVSATVIILYTSLVPLSLWALLKWSVRSFDLDVEESPHTPSLLSLICVYGYSLAIYIPVSILWTVQVSLFQWLMVATGTFLSGFALLWILMPAIKTSKYHIFITPSIGIAHFLLATGFMLYFFHSPDSSGTVVRMEQLKTTVGTIINKNATN
ncbi:protein YIPF1 [Toxorhynchites rutilus septentrionalis]|uniref:protein YIPF1 n=1 Tax=Toxorhynchites rutilus septentrionalis TaxID=329112 RepID=UPI002478BD68|nr:protein YIPF1 [Toxorhynchites rutilus septentrionalis]